MGEAIAGRSESGAGTVYAHAQRLQSRREVATDAIGQDQQQGAQTVEHSAFELILIQRCACFTGLVADFFARFARLGRGWIFAGKGRCEIIHRHGWPIAPCPSGARGFRAHISIRIAHRRKKTTPLRVNSYRVRAVAGLQLFEIFRVMVLHEA